MKDRLTETVVYRFLFLNLDLILLSKEAVRQNTSTVINFFFKVNWQKLSISRFMFKVYIFKISSFYEQFSITESFNYVFSIPFILLSMFYVKSN